jgi:hypothetical protein
MGIAHPKDVPVENLLTGIVFARALLIKFNKF